MGLSHSSAYTPSSRNSITYREPNYARFEHPIYLQNLGTLTVGGAITPSHHESTSTVTYTAPVDPNVDIDPRAISALDNYFSQFKLQNLGTFTVGGTITPNHHESTSTVTYTPPADVKVDIDPRFEKVMNNYWS